jgi:Flp pilus assembly protein TadD
MIKSSVRSAGVALLLLTANGCGVIGGTSTSARAPGLNVAEAALQGGAGQIALQVSEGVLQESPSNVHALEIKGDALVLLGEYDDATSIFTALLAKDPNSVRANMGLGRIRLAKDPAAAAALFEQVLKRDPKDLTALNDVGIARDLQGRHAEAQVSYRQALAINPDLDSAQVNLALSMAMSGQGPAAVKLLQAKATEPGAPVKVRHDYAVVLAMAGNRPEAERVLRQDLSADEARQVVDNATGTHTKPIPDGDLAAGRLASRDPRPSEDLIPPDVVQIPEVPSPVSHAAGRSATAQASPPPTVVRPASMGESDSSAPPNAQPVSPVAAAIVNQRPLALPIQSADALSQSAQGHFGTASPGATSAPDAAPAKEIITPKVVAMPPMLPVPRVLPMPPAEASNDPEPSVPQSSQVGSYKPYTPTPPDAVPAADAEPAAHAAEPAAHAAETLSASAKAAAKHAAVPAISNKFAMLVPPRLGETRGTQTSQSGMQSRHEGSVPAVQFTAAPSEAAARALWRTLVQRFPEVLGERESTVVRFERGSTVFWRLRAEGFGTLSDAQSLCARMRSAGQNCFVPRS